MNTDTAFLFGLPLATAGVAGVLFGARALLRMAALALPAQNSARQHMQRLRTDKMDKQSVFILSLQKGGSTLLCYVCALINTRDSIRSFRNDFDLVPMLSFPQALVYQNINVRQDGKYQLYKINGRARDLYREIREVVKAERVVWICREFDGYYRSVYWWIQRFYPRIAPILCVPLRILFFLRYVNWGTFKSQTLRLLAEDHVEELWHAYQLAKTVPADEFIAVSYEHLTEEKEQTLRRLAAWFGVEVDAEMLQSIMDKTSKEAMAIGDRFDPLRFGEGGGQTKVNLEAHRHRLNERESAVYEEVFRRRFHAVGISSYAQYIAELRSLQS